MVLRKFASILIAVLTIALCATSTAIAAEADRVFAYPLLTYGYYLPQPSTIWQAGITDGYNTYYNPDYETDHDQHFGSTYFFDLRQNSGCRYWYGLSYCNTLSAPSGQTQQFNFFLPGYTYYFELNCYLRYSTADAPEVPSVDSPDLYFFPGTITGTSIQNAYLYGYNPALRDVITSCNYAFTEGLSAVNGSYTEIGYKWSVTFNIASDENPSLMFSHIGTELSYPYNFGSTLEFHLSLAKCWYDPTGAIEEELENEIDQVVQGQKDAVDYGLDRELEENQGAYDDASDAAEDAASIFDNSSFLGGLTQVYNSLTYSGTDFHFYLPAAVNIPYVGNLWSQTEIPLKYYIDSLPPAVLFVIRFLLWVGAILVLFFCIRRLLKIINIGSE